MVAWVIFLQKWCWRYSKKDNKTCCKKLENNASFISVKTPDFGKNNNQNSRFVHRVHNVVEITQCQTCMHE